MNLLFVCQCLGGPGQQVTSEMETDFCATMGAISGCKFGDDPSSDDPAANGGKLAEEADQRECQFVLRFECVPGEEPLEQAQQLVAALSHLSSEHGVGWSVGHQMENLLGTISEGIPDPSLEAEIATSLRVAFALGQIVDEELMEEDDEQGLDELNPLTIDLQRDLENDDPESEDPWSGILDATEDFVRFPKFDDQ